MVAKGNNNAPSSASSSSKTGLLLIKIGVVLAFVIPIAVILAFITIGGGFGLFSLVPGTIIFGLMLAVVIIGGMLSIVALKFGYDAANHGQRNRANYVIILGVVVFVIGSNIAGILIAIGGYLCRK